MSENFTNTPTIDDFKSLFAKWRHDGLDRTSPENLTPVQCQEILEGFVSNVWNHPLITPELLEFRRQGQLRINELLIQSGIHDKTIAVPVGSTIWAITPDSDWDYVIFTHSKAAYAQASSMSQTMNVTDRVSLIFPTYDKLVDPNSYLLSQLQNEIFCLLIAPNEMIGGNVGLANHYRQTLVDPTKNGLQFNPAHDFNYYWEPYFVNFLKGWPIHFLGNSIKSGKRLHRFNERLSKRSEQSRNPHYVSDFMRNFDNFKAPGYDILRVALTHTQGELHFPHHAPRVTGIA